MRLIRLAMLLTLCACGAFARHTYRNMHDHVPHIITHWKHDTSQLHRFQHTQLEYWPLFTRFDHEHFRQHRIPLEPISYRHDTTRYIDSRRLTEELEDCLAQLLSEKRPTHSIGKFDIKKDSDFDYRHKCGVIILQSQDYPLIIKLFRETPYSMTRPFSKGIIPSFLFLTGGGNVAPRHLTGFTRIKNKHKIANILASSPRWQDRVTLPRKWFWQPSDGAWIAIHGYHFTGKRSYHYTEIPATYAIISDNIHGDNTNTAFSPDDRTTALELTNYLGGNLLDPHIDNFMQEQETGKIAIIDTEHFATLVGVRDYIPCSSYTSWYLSLTRKCFTDTFLRSKRERRQRQTEHIPEPLTL